MRVNIDNLSIPAMLKLPTGDVDSPSGSEGTDFTLWMEYMNGELLSTWGTTLSAMNGVVGLGGGKLSPVAQKDFAGVAGSHCSMSSSDRSTQPERSRRCVAIAARGRF